MLAILERDPATLRLHDAANQVPRMRPDEWAAFLADVDAQGVLEPVVITPDGIILDGRHRWEAAKHHGQETIPVREVNLTTLEQVEYILRAALLRRHLNDDQRAVLAARFREPLSKAVQAEAGKKGRAAQQEAGDLADVSKSPASPNVTAQHPSGTRGMVAEQFNVSERKVKGAIELERDAPDLANQVLAGDVSLREAHRQQAKAVQAETHDLLGTAGVFDQPSVQHARLRRQFSDAMGTLLDIEPGEVAAVIERNKLALWLQQLHEWGQAIEEALEQQPLRVVDGGRQ